MKVSGAAGRNVGFASGNRDVDEGSIAFSLGANRKF